MIRSIALPLLMAASAFPMIASAQAVTGSGVAASTRPNSPSRPIQFASQAPANAALAVLVSTAELPADAPLTEAERVALTAAIAGAGFSGKANEVLSLRGVGARPRIVLVGTGASPSPLAWQEAAGTAAQQLKGERGPVALAGATDATAMADAALGYALGQYRFDRYKSGATPPASDPVTVVGGAHAAASALWQGRPAALAEGVTLARDLANEPASVIYPASFVERAQAALAGVPGVTVEVLDEAAMRKLGMGSLVGVGQGSPRGSRLLVMSYRGAGAPAGAPLALVGKGITFDTGGISLKSGDMQDMKADMAGAAAVTGALVALARGRAPVNVVAVAALAENMPDGNAQRPGDVVRTLSGKTIEVINTDAEGRLVLADALEWVASRKQPAAIVDIATLTGAAVRALGSEYAALFARDDAIAAAVSAAATASGEPVWRMPLHPSYEDDVRSDIADVKNSGYSGPGAAMGATFVGHFVAKATPWAHVDMAGTMEAGKDRPLTPKGMSGYGVRLLEEFARAWKPGA